MYRCGYRMRQANFSTSVKYICPCVLKNQRRQSGLRSHPSCLHPSRLRSTGSRLCAPTDLYMQADTNLARCTPGWGESITQRTLSPLTVGHQTRSNIKLIYDYHPNNDKRPQMHLYCALATATHGVLDALSDRCRCLVTINAKYVHHVVSDKKTVFAARQ